MLLEMHCHSSEHSPCSTVPALELVQQVYAKGLHGLVLTDHFYLWSEEALAELRRAAGVPEHFVILSGHETNAPVFGDLLVFGASEVIPRGTRLEDIRERCPDAAIVWAHPYRDGREPQKDLICSPLLDALEIFNSNHTVRGNARGLQEWRRFGFTATAGTDTHAATYAGIYPTEFDVPVRTMEELIAAIKNRRCRPYFKETAHREARKVTEVAMGAQRQGRPGESVIIRTPGDHASWSKAERAFHIMEAIAAHGFDHGSYRVPQPVRKDPESGVLVEEAVGGVPLFDKLLCATAEEGREYLRMAARWLARLHSLALEITTPEEFLAEEARRLAGELNRFNEASHPYTRKVAEIAAAVKGAEEDLARRERDLFVQGHGDFHPKNISIAQDDPADPDTLYLAAIDFERSQFMPAAFDVGWFLAQFRSQFSSYPVLRGNLGDEEFLQAYAAEVTVALPEDFLRQVELFRARSNISISAYFIKMHLGDTRELWRILVESERALTYLT